MSSMNRVTKVIHIWNQGYLIRFFSLNGILIEMFLLLLKGAEKAMILTQDSTGTVSAPFIIQLHRVEIWYQTYWNVL
jgi:hypothetical protein